MNPIDRTPRFEADLEAERLEQLAACARDIGATTVADEAAALASRAAEGRFHVACLGEFKRGKSTVLNALLGAPILPTGVVPVTSAVIVVRQGAGPIARVHYTTRPSEDIAVERLAEFVTDNGNPANAKGVALVEVFAPSPLLAGGLCLVDTPGLGSASPLATVVTRSFVPQIDAALVILGADPPISGEELRFVEELGGEARDFIFAINKADKIDDADLVDVVVFTQRLLAERMGRVPDSLFIVSAAERLAQGVPTRDWSRLERALAALAAGRRPWLDQRMRSAAVRIGRQLVQAIDTLVGAVTEPVAETDRHLAALRQWLAEAQHAVADFGLLLAAEQQALARGLRDGVTRRAALVVAETSNDLRRAIDALDGNRATVRRAAFEQARTIARRAVQKELAELERQTAGVYQDLVVRFVALANEFLQRLAVTEPRLGQLPPIATPEDLAGRRRFFFTEMMTLTAGNPLEWLNDWTASNTAVRRRLLARAQAYLKRLVATNASRAVHDLEERLIESRHDLESDIRGRLAELVGAADRAVARAQALRESGEVVVVAELQRLTEIRRRVEAILSAAGVTIAGDARTG